MMEMPVKKAGEKRIVLAGKSFASLTLAHYVRADEIIQPKVHAAEVGLPMRSSKSTVMSLARKLRRRRRPRPLHSHSGVEPKKIYEIVEQRTKMPPQ
jgi:hypothetical protein